MNLRCRGLERARGPSTRSVSDRLIWFLRLVMRAAQNRIGAATVRERTSASETWNRSLEEAADVVFPHS